MAQLNYERRGTHSRTSPEPTPATELVVPLLLLAAGLGLMFYLVHPRGGSFAATAFVVGILGVIYAVVGLIVAYVTAYLLSFGFGEFWPGTIKLAGILVFSAALGSLPFGIIWGFLSLYILMIWLFEMESKEVIIFALVLRVVTFGISIALMGIFARR